MTTDPVLLLLFSLLFAVLGYWLGYGSESTRWPRQEKILLLLRETGCEMRAKDIARHKGFSRWHLRLDLLRLEEQGHVWPVLHQNSHTSPLQTYFRLTRKGASVAIALYVAERAKGALQ